MLEMSALPARRGYWIFYYGGSPDTLQRLQDVLEQRFPGLNVVGTISPLFGPLPLRGRRDSRDDCQVRPNII